MELFLTLLSGIAWTTVYIVAIYKGFKDKSYAIPLFALGANICWEAIYSIAAMNSFGVNAQSITNIVWCLFDIVVVYTYFKYGVKYFPANAKRYFISFSVLSFAVNLLLQLAFYLQFPILAEAAQYSAFLQNAIMSILFIVMLFQRNSTEGQSMIIAVAKWIGTLAPTILMGVVQGFNIYVIICGIICTVFDLIYIYFLAKWNRAEKNY